MTTKEWAADRGWNIVPSWQEGFFEIHGQFNYPVCCKGYESAQQFASERACLCKLAAMKRKQEEVYSSRRNRPIYLGD
jgi:hypothetical protein